ncbi:hypothetical protein WEI85_18490 [Actinomycetes bacterium KLBMP 9797]
MLIDCDSCAGRGKACGDCLVTALIDTPQRYGQLDDEERQAVEVFARAGFDVEVISEPERPPLRLMPGGRRRRRVA